MIGQKGSRELLFGRAPIEMNQLLIQSFDKKYGKSNVRSTHSA